MSRLVALVTVGVAALTVTAFAVVSCVVENTGFDWHQVSIGGRVQCLPVASSLGAQHQGLQGVKHVVRPMVFAYSPPDTPSFWMDDTPAPLTGVWVGAAHRVIGYWQGQPESDALHPPPAPVSAVIEYPRGAPVPARGTAVTVGGHCPAQVGL